MFVSIYTLILCLSAGFAAWALVRIRTRLGHGLKIPPEIPSTGMIALLSAVSFLMVVGAPGYVLVAALVLAALSGKLRMTVSYPGSFLPAVIGLTFALAPFVVTPIVLFVPSWFALDAAIILAALAGALAAAPSSAMPGQAALPLLLLPIWLSTEAVLAGAFIPAYIATACCAGTAVRLNKLGSHQN